jgi:hypothetical protein
MHLLAPQVEESVAQPRLLGRVGVAVDLQGQRVRDRLHHQIVGLDLDLPRGELRIDGRRRSRHHAPGHRHHALEAEALGGGEMRAARVQHDLREPEVVPQVEEEQGAMVTLPVDPARQPDGATDVTAPELPARMGAIGVRRRAHPTGLSGLTVADDLPVSTTP